MGRSGQWAATICQVGLLLGGLSWPALAGQIWAGAGQITSGSGQGGTVQLVLEVEGNRVRSRSGPPLTGQVQSVAPARAHGGLNGSIQTETGSWRFQQLGDELRVILYQGDQVIYYRLRSR